MITISDGKLTIPEGQRFIGFTGDNRHTQKKFFIRNNSESGWLYRLYLTFDDGTHNHFVLPATVSEEGTWLTWNIEENHIFKSGLVKAQIKAFSGDSEVYHTTSDVFVAGKATEEDDEFKNSNSEFLLYEKTLNDLYKKMLSASAKMPYVGTNGNWFTYDVNKDEYVDSGVSAYVQIAEGGITQDLLDRVYWQKTDRIPVYDYGAFDSILDSKDAASTVYRMEFSGISPLKSAVGEGSFLAVASADCSKLLILNTTNADRWLYEKGSLRLRNIEAKSENISDSSIIPAKLDRVYWEYIGKFTVSTYEELDEILASKEHCSNVIFNFVFESNSVLNHATNGTEFIASNGLFRNVYSGKTWRYENKKFTDVTGNALTFVKMVIMDNYTKLSDYYDAGIGVAHIDISGGGDLPFGRYLCIRFINATVYGGYLIFNIDNGALYKYIRSSEKCMLIYNPAIMNEDIENLKATLDGLDELLKGI